MTDKKEKLKSKWLSRGLVISIIAFFVLVSFFRAKSEGAFQDVFHKKSGIKIESLNENQVINLNKLCKVWGFVKYYHPKVISSSLNWDFELFRIIPKIMETKDSREVDKVLYNWVNELGDVKISSENGSKDVMMEPDTAWIKNDNYISKELSDLLVKLSKTYISERNKGYVSFEKDSPYASFKNENSYQNMTYDDEGYKLLSLFRYWNIIEYYYPYREVMGEDWDGVLTEFIPKFIECRDSLSYKLTVAELTTKIHDSHAYVTDKRYELGRYWGYNIAPIKFQLVEDKIVITEIAQKYAADCKAKKGDIVLKLNDKDIFEVIKEKAKYKSTSNDKDIVKDLLFYLLNTQEDSLTLTLERDGKEIRENIKCYFDGKMFVPTQSHKLLTANIGYINPGALAKGEIDKIMSEFKDTKGLIVDLRYYPSDSIMYTLGNYLMPQKVIFAKVTAANQAVAGEFISLADMEVGKDNPNFYKGKVIIIINEYTQSNAEFTTMSLRKAPNAQVIGSNSIGADGNIAVISLPGGIETAISGIGIYNPDKSETQRVGIKPDIYIKPTIQGIKEGRDELVEKAIELINN
ncbi:S41 family peptidase [Candidatus Clostridium radicumherbarum]|uniref:S41 family peptidase n=1 Tax=Candidatus Clostridium radicumherbarum TaxID=3381662 RepID=A0ABW8TRF6_9CLOT